MYTVNYTSNIRNTMPLWMFIAVDVLKEWQKMWLGLWINPSVTILPEVGISTIWRHPVQRRRLKTMVTGNPPLTKVLFRKRWNKCFLSQMLFFLKYTYMYYKKNRMNNMKRQLNDKDGQKRAQFYFSAQPL